MPALKKIKKWASRTHRDVQRAEQAADRAEAALQQITEMVENSGHDTDETGVRRASIYTSPAGHDVTPPAAAAR